jgi:hypothetical protein
MVSATVSATQTDSVSSHLRGKAVPSDGRTGSYDYRQAKVKHGEIFIIAVLYILTISAVLEWYVQ